MEHNDIVVRAAKSFCDGTLKAPQQVSFLIDEFFKLTGIIDSPLTTVLFSRPVPVEVNPVPTPSVFEQTESSRMSGDLKVTDPDHIRLRGHVGGDFTGKAILEAILSGLVRGNAHVEGQSVEQTKTSTVEKDFVGKAVLNVILSGLVGGKARLEGLNIEQTETSTVEKDFVGLATLKAILSGIVRGSAHVEGQSAEQTKTSTVERDFVGIAVLKPFYLDLWEVMLTSKVKQLYKRKLQK